MTRASEILQVTSVSQRVQEKIKSITVQDKPHLDFVAEHALNLREEEMSTGISKDRGDNRGYCSNPGSDNG